MNNPIAQLISQAEASLSDMGRRAVESVTVPVRAKSQELIAEVTAAVKASLRAIIIKVVLGLFAVVMAIIALAYALSALHTYLAEQLGPLDATLIMAGVFLALAILAIVVMAVWPSGPPKKPSDKTDRAVGDADAAVIRARLDAEAAARSTKAKASAQQSPEDPVDTAPNPLVDMKSGLGAIASALGEAGFRREQAGLRAGLAIAEQLKPMQLVSLALLGGFLAGVRRRRR